MRIISKNKMLYFLIYFLCIIEGSLIYILLFRISNKELTVIPLVSTILLLVVSGFLVIIQLKFILRNKFKELLTCQDFVLIFTLIFFINYNLYGLIPFNVSRSNSIIMMGYLKSQKEHPLTESEIRFFVEKKYFQDYNAIQKRLNEQIAAGNIQKIDDKYVITTKGLFIVNLFSKVSSLYNIDNDFTKVAE